MPTDSRSSASLSDLIGLQTPPARLAVFSSITLFLVVIPYHTLLSIPTVSVFARVGIHSPSIGLTRAYWYVLHGQFQNAWQMNKLIFLVVPIVLALVVRDLLMLIRKS